MNKPKILIYGVGSYKNKGCEALVKSTINQMDEASSIVIGTYDYDFNKTKYNNLVKYVNHYSKEELNFTIKEKKEFEKIKHQEFKYENYEYFYERYLINEIPNADIVMHLGGDNYCYGRSPWIYAVNTKARKLGKKLVLWGASLYDEITDYELIEDLKKYDLLILREPISYNAVKKYIPEEKLLLIPDPAFSLSKDEVKLDNWYKNQKKILGLNLSPLVIDSDEKLETIYNFVDYILEKTDYSISLIPHVTVEEVSDMKILTKIREKYESESRIFLEKETWDCSQIKYIISKCDMLIAARTHASIAAYSTCVPTLVLGYSTKSRGIAEDLFGKYEKYVLPKDEMNIESLIDCFSFVDSESSKIIKILNSKMKDIILKSSNIYNRMIERLDKLEKETICGDKCSGCTACANVCPVSAITMKENSEGFMYPFIDDSKCIHCNKCRKVCPILNGLKELNSKFEKECYAAKSKNNEIRKNSSSGGIFTHIAEYYLNNNGIVYGAALENFETKHIRIDDINDLYKIRGSKYSQSNMQNTFELIKNDLDNNMDVLFSGTPCQINGLQAFLGKDYSNLLLVSVICHGVISTKLVSKRKEEFEKNYNCHLKHINFKSKKNTWEKSSIYYESDIINKCYTFNDDPMMFLFNNNFALRNSCYNCINKRDTKSDIILGDYWGVYNEHKDIFDQNGVSAIVINSKKGKSVFNKIKKNIEYVPTTYEQISKYNSCITESVEKPVVRNVIYNLVDDNSLDLIKTKCEFEKVNKENEEHKQKVKALIDENIKLCQEKNQITSSRRYKAMNKLFKPVDAIRDKFKH